ncbi:hypothetical protein [Deinococcus sp.]|uniref:hypothetical protein n=1 Tax=Deinococcus sp. TaxID=47478 RepID=UPI002869C362|nr:hypothetical protein [Deinococcus sp.]
MGHITALVNVSLDGVMQAPARPDEDIRGSFTQGGWAAPYAAMEDVPKAMTGVQAMLFGRRTYQDFQAAWSHRTDTPSPRSSTTSGSTSCRPRSQTHYRGRTPR